jgi:hypothetical protein
MPAPGARCFKRKASSRSNVRLDALDHGAPGRNGRFLEIKWRKTARYLVGVDELDDPQ